MTAMTRGQFVLQLVAKMGKTQEAIAFGGGGFDDTAGTYVDAAASYLKSLGIITGVGGNKFDPSRVITRAEAATIFAKAADLTGSNQKQFTDTNPASGTTPWVNAAGQAGLFNGVGGGRFDPNAAFDSAHFDIVIANGGDIWANSTVWDTPPHVGPDVVPGPGTDPNSSTTPAADPVDPDGTGDSLEPIHDRSAVSFIERLVVEEWGIDNPGVLPFLEQAYDEKWTADEMMLRLYENQNGTTQWFHDRFPAYGQLGSQEQWPSPSEYVALETEYRRILRAGGMPEGFYDHNDDFTEMIVKNVAPAELHRRVAEGYAKVQASDPALRQAFADLFGVTGDEALAAFFIDQGKTEQLLDTQQAAAGISASGGTLGISVGLEKAMQIAGIGHTRMSSLASFSRLDAISSLFDETMSEAEDMALNEEGLSAEFGLEAGARAAMERRRMARVGAFSGGGRAVATEEGIIGA